MYGLPLQIDLETKAILRASSKANEKLAELKGTVRQLPNPKILLNAVTLREAKESSEIENIVTTYDDLYREMALKSQDGLGAKEVLNYRSALTHGCNLVEKNGFISTNTIVAVHNIIDDTAGGIRQRPGTTIINSKTRETIHTPLQGEDEIREYLKNLEDYINDDTDEVDSLIRMAVIHLQFEMIHPFYDGNGRTGRILNIMYLYLTEKLEQPILYLSKYIIENKDLYYDLLMRSNDSEEVIGEFVEYILKGIEETSIDTMIFIKALLESIENTASLIQDKLPKLYSKELVEALFFEFYTKNEYLRNALDISRNTATKYLQELESIGILRGEQIGKERIYKNIKLFELVSM